MTEKFSKMQQQFLCCYPVNKMSWSSVKLPMDWDEQKALIAATCGHPLNERYPVRASYQEAFVKRLMQLLKDHEELHDDLFSSLTSQKCEQQCKDFAYKHYLLLQPDAHITLRESISFVNEGTTGLCTWEAALALADYLMQHSDVVKGKNIVELGAGTGLIGILLKLPVLGFDAGQILLTDGSASCVQLMRDNVALNFPETPKEAIPQCAQLRWDEVKDFPWQQYAKTDLLLAADVIYDDSQFDALLDALDHLYTSRGNCLEMLLASTVRNVDTLHKFMEQLAKREYKVTPCANVSACVSHFCRDHTAAVQIISIKR